MEMVDGKIVLSEVDTNYIFRNYIQSYRYHNNNQMPEKIVFPLFPAYFYKSLTPPDVTVTIAIEYVEVVDAALKVVDVQFEEGKEEPAEEPVKDDYVFDEFSQLDQVMPEELEAAEADELEAEEPAKEDFDELHIESEADALSDKLDELEGIPKEDGEEKPDDSSRPLRTRRDTRPTPPKPRGGGRTTK